MIQKTLAIISGGKSSRMNFKNKAFLRYNEKTFIENIILAGKNFAEIIIITNSKNDYTCFEKNIYPDIYIGQGAISGIHSALVHSKYEKVLCVACDMPKLQQDTLEKIANTECDSDILIPDIFGKLQPLCAMYDKKISSILEKNIENNTKKLHEIIKKCNYQIIENLDAQDFININTQEEFENL